MSTETNPLLAGAFRIPFHEIEARHVEPGIDRALEEAQREVDETAADPSPPTWDNTMERLERATRQLTERISPVTHLMSVAETPELREAYNRVLPRITAFTSRLPLHEGLWQRLKAYAETREAAGLVGLRRRHLDKTLREFRRAGADLPPQAKARLEALQVELAQLQQTFSEHVLDETAAYRLVVTDERRLEGIPPAARRRAREKARARGEKGWVLTLDYPAVEPVLKYCRDRELRREILTAYATRCQGGAHDNRGLIARILRLRDELAELLGYGTYADYALEDRMAATGARAVAFEADLVERTRPYWERDVAAIVEHARTLGIDALEPWDSGYVMEDLRRAKYDIDDETLRPYFPLPHVLEGLFEIVRRTFGFRVEEREAREVWHPDVRYYEILDDTDGTFLGAFYTDWFPRDEKRQGAWMNDFITGGPRAEAFAPHLGVICANFTPPEGDRPALLTHREVQTIFHEFGHLLHHCTSRVEIPSRAGINVAWDWVELPSQLMENWTWEREALDLFARHHETGEPLPDALFERLVAARRFMGGWFQMRQLSLGTVDLALHCELAPRLRREAGGQDGPELDARQGEEVMRFARERFGHFAARPRFAELHALTSFTHLFSGGYAAAYYSYLWSEVLDADVFTRFKREGIFNSVTGRSYVDAILSRGDSSDPDALFVEFMGRPPDPDALLERNLGALVDA
ncbi:MAG TPA: M3 family metallopeptidase [Longimicrobiales bacterium]|nr:M3 family metallopeptidase [Longimicrobiales bacterium]